MSGAFLDIPRSTILLGDAAAELGRLPDGQVDCVVTSPPYFRLRDYGHQKQVGLEGHVDAWVEELRQVMRQAARVLVPAGTLWLNLGDTYSSHPSQGAPAKSLLAGPERLLRVLMDDGWLVRNKIIWAKANPIPTSVTDRLACGYEVIYLLTRSPSYHFDLHAIRTPHTSTPKPRTTKTGKREISRGEWRGPNADGDSGLRALHAAGLPGHPLGKNPGDVWRLATSRYRGAHFATYPEALVRQMLLAGCPERRCQQCRSAWQHPIRRLGAVATRLALRPSCACRAPSEPGLVLDPFMGSGTTAVVAEQLKRDWLGIELNVEYQHLAYERIRTARAPTPAASAA